MSNSNRTVVPEAKAALNQMKLEIANEIGLSNYENIDKGNLTARENGYVGGYMTKKLVEMAE
ncbi:alpha/beta-type small acid-soluble spore protein, partial [Clostridioides difficile]